MTAKYEPARCSIESVNGNLARWKAVRGAEESGGGQKGRSRRVSMVSYAVHRRTQTQYNSRAELDGSTLT